MGAFKTLNSQDIIISPLEVTKGFSFEGNALTASNVGIERFLGAKFQTSSSTGYTTEFSQSSIYYSSQQLYYSNYISSSNGEVQKANIQTINPDGTTIGEIGSNAFDNFTQTNLNPEKYWPTSSYTSQILTSSLDGQVINNTSSYSTSSNFDPTIGVISVPKSIFGDYMLPRSINIITDSGSYYDDGEGRLIRSNIDETLIVVGNIIYGQGIIIFTGGSRQESTGELGYWESAEYGIGVYNGRTIGNNDVVNFVNTSNITMSFSSSFTLHETQYKCTITENDFNYSQNPTTISSSSNNGAVYEYVTGSYFSPYVTTVGLYNNNNELMAVGKMAQPLPTSRTTDTTILINIDRQ
jgi:hypothetical protein